MFLFLPFCPATADPTVFSFTLSAYRSELIVWSAEEAACVREREREREREGERVTERDRESVG